MTENHAIIIALNMADFNRKNTYSFWHSPIVLFILFCVLGFFIYNMIGLIEKERETAKKKELKLAEIETLRAREEIINNDIEKLKTEDGVEETIREKYQVVKEGEKMVVIVDSENKINNSPVDEPTEDNLWGWIKSKLGFKN